METPISKQNNSNTYPPVVSVLGHVDHGKTTLLDTLRKTNHASSEAGGITQNIGASQIQFEREGVQRVVTFIDTPGHEAFSNMRSQGVSASDIVLLVIAADDGIMPQTKESIEKILESKLPFIVVITKIDSQGANIERVKQQVAKEGILLEGLGGDTPFVGVSAKTGEHIPELLDLIVLMYDMAQVKKEKDAPFLGVVIDARLDKKRGIVASVVVKQGIIQVANNAFTLEKEVGKVRAIFNVVGKSVKEVNPGEAIELLGLTEVLPTGSLLYTQKQEKVLPVKVEQDIVKAPVHDLAQFFGETPDHVAIILKTETSGELEAIKNSLPEDVRVVFEGQGDIGVSEILMAKDFKALVLGFHVGIKSDAQRLAENEKVFFKTYKIIYELLDEVQDVATMMKEEDQPKLIGKGIILASFDSEEGRILGVRVHEGKFIVGNNVIVMRGDKEIGTSTITTIKKGKESVKEISKGNECGIKLAAPVDFQDGDMLLSYNKPL